MPLALILSSYVAASRVGGMAQALALAPFKIDPVLIPTTLYGRHPGWGPPGGAAVDPATFKSMIEGVAANGLLPLTDVILTGYFASPEQVWIASETIALARAQARDQGKAAPLVIVDPVMGDSDAGLYVKPEVADAIAHTLVADADVLTPNKFELCRLTTCDLSVEAMVAAARSLGKPVLVTSAVDRAPDIGTLYVDAEQALVFLHRRHEKIPRGTGDLIAVLFAAHRVGGETPMDAAERAVQGVAETVDAAVAWNAPELPIVALGERLVRPTATVAIQTLSGPRA